MLLSLTLSIGPFWPVEAKADAATGPSFACAKAASAIEKAVCASPALSKADLDMATLYAQAKISAFDKGPSNQLAMQRATLKGMQSCTQRPRAQLEACLQSAYDARNEALASGIALRAPDLALPVIKRIDPAFAPVIEAFGLFAAEPDKADWASPTLAERKARIEELLRPAITELLSNPDTSYPASILADPGSDGITVRDLDDLFRSPRHFARALNVLGPYLAGDAHERYLPCQAFVRHPVLVTATDGIFGSSLDNGVFRDDCQAMLPPVPALDALAAKLVAGWPECEGTIRFAAYRMFDSVVTAARLGRPERQSSEPPPARRDVAKADIKAAQTALAAYYTTYLDMPASQAATVAVAATRQILDYGQECE